jgi:hypothetical protein
MKPPTSNAGGRGELEAVSHTSMSSIATHDFITEVAMFISSRRHVNAGRVEVQGSSFVTSALYGVWQ